MHYKAEDCVDLSQTYQSELAEPPDYSRDVTTLVTDYLSALRKQVMRELERKFTAAALKSYRIDWVITTPAVWSMKAKDDTLRCAEKAGMGTGRSITLVSEPEAAAAYAFSVIEPMTLKAGNNIVVCDAGGGTVDLITYRILDLAPLEVEESAVSCGGKCGGVFVNRIFEKMIDDRIGKSSGLTDIGRHQVNWTHECRICYFLTD
jgi:molecular chaperone DnaK (HSP70)